jgi:hypothetical protein
MAEDHAIELEEATTQVTDILLRLRSWDVWEGVSPRSFRSAAAPFHPLIVQLFRKDASCYLVSFYQCNALLKAIACLIRHENATDKTFLF